MQVEAKPEPGNTPGGARRGALLGGLGTGQGLLKQPIRQLLEVRQGTRGSPWHHGVDAWPIGACQPRCLLRNMCLTACM